MNKKLAKKSKTQRTKITKNGEWKKRLRQLVIVVVLGVGFKGIWEAFGREQAQIVLEAGAAFRAKTLCAGLYVSGRSVENVEAQELYGDGDPLYLLLSVLTNTRYLQSADSRLNFVHVFDRLGLGISRWYVLDRSLAFRYHLGCRALPRYWEANETQSDFGYPFTLDTKIAPSTYSSWNWHADINSKLDIVLDKHFAEEVAGKKLKRTRALVVVQDGRIVAERYAEQDGFSRDTPHLGWSMSKGII